MGGEFGVVCKMYSIECVVIDLFWPDAAEGSLQPAGGK